MKYLLLLCLCGVGWAQGIKIDSLEPGQSATFIVTCCAPASPHLTQAETELVREKPLRLATKEECWIHVFPCRAGVFVTYVCPTGYALLNQWNRVLGSSIPDGEADEEDVWDETPRPLHKCQNVSDWQDIIALRYTHGPISTNAKLPIPKELQ